jgi:hypothetical protein
MRPRRPLSGFDKLEVDTENPPDAGCISHALNEIFVCRVAAPAIVWTSGVKVR